MPDPDHVLLVRQGVDAWNRRRSEDRFTPDLSNADFGGEFLPAINLRDADLSGADFSFANLRGANLLGANIQGTDFSGASLADAMLGMGEDDWVGDYGRWKKKEQLESKVSRLPEAAFSVPHRKHRIVDVCFDGTKLRAATLGVNEDRGFAAVIRNAEVQTRELLATTRLDNISRPLQRAFRMYLEALEGYHLGDGEIPLGLAGAVLQHEISARGETIDGPLGEAAGTIRAIALNHRILEKMLPEWLAFSGEARGITESRAEAQATAEDIEDIADGLRGSVHVDTDIPASLTFLVQMIREPAAALQKALFAGVRAVEDIFLEVFGVLLDSYRALKARFVKAAPVLTLVAILAAVPEEAIVGLVSRYSGQIGWIRQALDWLKSVGAW